MGNIDQYFTGGIARKKIMAFLGTYNMADQAIAIDETNAENIQSTGTAPAVINGVLIPALAADAELDISEDATGDAAGTVIADGNEQFFAVMADASGVLSVLTAGSAAATGSATCQVPDYDPETYCCVAVMKIDASGANFTVGTTALTGRVVFYQMIGPVFAHPNNMDNQ